MNASSRNCRFSANGQVIIDADNRLVIADGAYLGAGLVVPHRKKGRTALPARPVAMPCEQCVYGAGVIDTDGARLGAEAARRLAEADCCEIAPGLTDEEFSRIEATYGFEFSPEHRAFLAAGLPVASPFQEGATWQQPWPDWRSADVDDLRDRLEWPAREVLADVAHGSWHPALEARPATIEEAVEVARAVLAQAPQLVPVYAHRFVPAGRDTPKHPVLSVWGTDIICYGHDLADYIDREFVEVDEDALWAPRASVPFWKDFLR